MPKFSEIEIATQGGATVFVPSANGDVTVWLTQDADFASGDTLTYARRRTSANQTTRKSTLNLTKALIDECEATCSTASRGTVLAKLEVTSSVQSLETERADVYDKLVLLLADTDVRDAFITNGSFYS